MLNIQFSKSDEQQIFDLVEKLIHTRKIAAEKPMIFLNNIRRRMIERKCTSLKQYLLIAQQDKFEYQQLLSALSIHTTYWFREAKHFDAMVRLLEKSESLLKSRIRILSMGCSQGQEVYSIGLVLSHLKTKNPGFDYSLIGEDIDPVSIQIAQRAVYPAKELGKIPMVYHKWMMIGSGKTDGLMTLDKSIRTRSSFAVGDALSEKPYLGEKFDIIFCRNMLIYFDHIQINKIVKRFLSHLKPEGFLFVGHSEDISQYTEKLKRVHGSIYQLGSRSGKSEPLAGRPLTSIFGKEARYSNRSNNPATSKRSESENATVTHFKDRSRFDVLVVDDSKTMLTQMDFLLKSEGLTSMGVEDAEAASEALKRHSFKLILLDLNLPKMRGDEWLMKIRSKSIFTPCIIVSGIHQQDIERVLKVLENKAQDFFHKEQIIEQKSQFIDKIKSFTSSKSNSDRKPKNRIYLALRDRTAASQLLNSLETLGYSARLLDAPGLDRGTPLDNPLILIYEPGKDSLVSEETLKRIASEEQNLPVLLCGDRSSFDFGPSFKPGLKVIGYRDSPEKLSEIIEEQIEQRYSGALSKLDLSALERIDLILIGSSTGGPQAVEKVLRNLPKNFPPVVLVHQSRAKG